MTPAAALNNSAFGQRWPRESTSFRDLFPRIEREELNPRSLQARYAPEESPLDILEDPREEGESQISTVSLRQRLRNTEIERTENNPRVIALSEASRHVLGENGSRRFQDFSNYQPGWNLGQGAVLSARSVTITDSFLTRLPELAAYEPSLFLTPEGNLELAWEDRSGSAVEIEFWPDKIEYYVEALNEERTLRLESFHQFIEKVRSLIR
jgi:hypothetical protein